MTTSQTPDFHLNRPGVLIAALPAVLGFVPEKSLVLVTIDRGDMGCVMRVDLSDELVDSLGHVADVAASARPDSAIAVVIDEEGALRESSRAYDKTVAGVVSGGGDYRAGVVLDKQETQGNRKPVALVGKVACKVEARDTPIEVGDLLTTAPTPGYAMKANDPSKAPGAVIGKALQRLTEGRGMIGVLVSLQ